MAGYDQNFEKFDEQIPFKISQVEYIDNGPTCWKSQRFVIENKLTGKVLKEFTYNYGCNGPEAFQAFSWEDRWYIIYSPTYTTLEIFDVETGEVKAKSEKDGSWCPVGVYIACRYFDPEMSLPFTSAIANGPTKIDYVFSDNELHETIEDGSIEKFDIKNLKYVPVLFICGVYWAADHEWLVNKFDLNEIMKTGIIHLPSKESYIFDINYNLKPEIRQFIKLSSDISSNGKFWDRFEYISSHYNDNWFGLKGK